MPYKDPEKQRAAWRRYYRLHPEEFKQRRNQKRKKNRAWLKEIKNDLECEICGEDEPCCLDFHHIDPEKKEVNIGGRTSMDWAQAHILEEMNKCQVLCANCHRKAHYGG